jgi:hypothetical protein
LTGPLKNEEGQVSGAKAILLVACALAVAWLVRDLAAGREISEWHTALLGVLLLVGLVNRMSARGRFRLKLGKDGGELEADSREERRDL